MCFRNGKCIPVHRNILVARSPVFAELLRRAEEEQEGEKVCGKTYKKYLKYEVQNVYSRLRSCA